MALQDHSATGLTNTKSPTAPSDAGCKVKKNVWLVDPKVHHGGELEHLFADNDSEKVGVVGGNALLGKGGWCGFYTFDSETVLVLLFPSGSKMYPIP